MLCCKWINCSNSLPFNFSITFPLPLSLCSSRSCFIFCSSFFLLLCCLIYDHHLSCVVKNICLVNQGHIITMLLLCIIRGNGYAYECWCLKNVIYLFYCYRECTICAINVWNVRLISNGTRITAEIILIVSYLKYNVTSSCLLVTCKDLCIQNTCIVLLIAIFSIGLLRSLWSKKWKSSWNLSSCLFSLSL